MKVLVKFILVLLFFSLPVFSEKPKELIFKKFFSESESDTKYVFGRPSAPSYDQEGNFYIYEASNGLFYKYSVKGEYITRFGKGLGEGPGEMPSFGVDFCSTKSNLYLYNFRGLLSSFSHEGKYLWSRRMKFKNSMFLTISGMISDGVGYGSKCPIDNFTLRQLILFSDYGAKNKEIAHLDYSKYQSSENFPVLGYLSIFVTTQDKDGRVYWADNQEYTVHRSDWKENIVLVKENVTPFYASEEFKKDALKEMKKRYTGGKYSFHVLDTFPVIRGLQVDKENNLWILSYSRERNGFAKYDHQGRYLKFFKYRGLFFDKDYRNVVFCVAAGYVYIPRYDSDEGYAIYRAKIPE